MSYEATWIDRETGILLVGHGTRKREGVLQLLELTSHLQVHYPHHRVESSFLELAEPSIAAAIESLTKAGLRKVVAIPILLFEAGHSKEDIPNALREACRLFQVELLGITPPLGCHPKVLELSRNRMVKACSDVGFDVRENFDQTALAMVGRGGSDRTAIREMLRFAQFRRGDSPFPWLKTGFLAKARPNLHELLEGAFRACQPTIVVQPHLLFEGTLMDEIRKVVGEFQARDLGKRWIVTESLGASMELGTIFQGLLEELR